MPVINGFFEEYRFLSNFYYSPVMIFGIEFDFVENAYQSAKCENYLDRRKFVGLKPGEAKKLGRKIAIRKDFDRHKVSIMKDLIDQKFNIDHLKKKLLATGDAELFEGNTWGDMFWGVDIHTMVGQNQLGKLIMEKRDRLRIEGEGS